jgi:glutaredoxin-dependent peroxiredoxin
MTIRPGDKAPAFTLPSKPGNPVDLSTKLGHEPVVLLFFPLAFSSVCTAEMCHMRESWDQWKSLGASVYGISVDSPFVTDKFREMERIPFPILSDFNKEVSRQYGVLHEDLLGLKGVSKRSAFVIGKDGKVKYAWVTEDPKVQVPFDEVKKALAA